MFSFSSTTWLHPVLLGLALSGPVETTPLPVHPEEARLRLRVELSRKASLFLEQRPDALEVLAAGWKVKRFRVAAARTGDDLPVRLTRVAEVVPLDPPPEKVVDVGSMEAPDPSGTTTSLEDIVGVEEMPDTFVVRFDEGTSWFVTSDRWGGPVFWLRKKYLWWRTSLELLTAEERRCLWVMETDLSSARHLYWILQQDLAVIQ